MAGEYSDEREEPKETDSESHNEFEETLGQISVVGSDRIANECTCRLLYADYNHVKQGKHIDTDRLRGKLDHSKHPSHDG